MKPFEFQVRGQPADEVGMAGITENQKKLVVVQIDLRQRVFWDPLASFGIQSQWVTRRSNGQMPKLARRSQKTLCLKSICTMPKSSSFAVSKNEQERILDQAPERLKEACSSGAIDHAVVTAHRHAHSLTHRDVAVSNYGLVLDGADRENRRLGRIDDRGEMLDVEHAKVRYRERPARV